MRCSFFANVHSTYVFYPIIVGAKSTSERTIFDRIGVLRAVMGTILTKKSCN